MAWMVATKKFPYGGITHEVGEKFFMPDSDDIYRRLFIEEGKAMEDPVLNSLAIKSSLAVHGRIENDHTTLFEPGHIQTDEKTAADCAPKFDNAGYFKGYEQPRDLKAVEDEEEDKDKRKAKPMTTDDAEALLEPKQGRYARRDMRPRR